VVDRVAGATRYGTAAAVATEAYEDGADCVLIATGEGFADALAASGLAGSEGCPILLVQQNSIPEETSAAIDDLGASSATIVGGTAAVSQEVEDSLSDDLGLTVDRVAGTNRYETAGEVADAIGSTSGTVIIASGEVAADALAAGPIAANLGAPILLVTTNDVPAATADRLGDATDVLIAGGTARISDDTQGEIEDDSADADGAERLAGVNRQETSAAIAEYEVDTLGWAPTSALLAAPSAPNDDFSPDALVAGPLGGLREAPILIVVGADDLGTPASDFLDDHSDTITEVDLIGGTAVLSDEVFTAAETAVQTTDNDQNGANETATSRPELVSATITETRTSAASTATRPPGTYVQYCFDEPITGSGIVAADFHLYNGDGTRMSGTATSAPTGQTFTSGVDATNNKCANVIYPALATAASVASLTLATVEKGAVTGSAADTNIEGDSALTPSSNTAAAAGVTDAPDLVSVGNFRDGPTADVTAVDFTFDQAAFVQAGGGGFSLVATDGTTYACQGPTSGSTTASGQAAPGGEGTTTLTVNCVEPAGSVQHSATNVARGVAARGAVATTAGGATPNPLEAADVANSGNSDAPTSSR